MFWRSARDVELEAGLAIAPRHVGDELVGSERALAVWRRLLRNPTFHNAVFFDAPSRETELLGFGAAAFVTPDFVDAEITNPRPGLNARFIASIACGDRVLLDADELRHANTYGCVDILCLLGVYPEDVGRERALEMLAFMAASFVEDFAGYRIRRLISEPIGQTEIANFLSTDGVWRCERSFDALTGEDASLWGRDRALFVMSRDDVVSVPTSNANPLFRFSPPVLQLREADQQLLKAALRDVIDDELAEELNVHVGTVKKRWLEIYNRIAETRPEMFAARVSADGDKTRGKQKRHRVLAYVREHPEELRPHEFRDIGAPF